MKTIKLGILIACVIGFGAHSVFGLQKSSIKMLCSDWPVWETARAMNSLGLLPSGFKFYFREYTTSIDRFKGGVADITFLTLYDFIFTQQEGQDGVIIAITDYSSGGDKIVVSPNIKLPSGLIGKKWALQSNSISLWLAKLYLNKHGFDLNDIKIRHIKGENVGKEIMRDPSLVAGVGWNPNFDKVPASMGKVITTSADFPRNIFDVIVVKRKSLEKNRDLYNAFLNAWFKAIKNPRVTKEIARIVGVSVAEYQGWLKNAHLYRTKKKALQAFPEAKEIAKEIVIFFNQDPPSSIKRRATRGMFGEGKQIDIDKLFDDSLLRE